MEQHPGESIVATAVTRSVPIYRSPSARHPFTRLPNPTKIGAPLVFLVKSRGNGWEQVFLPIRPDGSTGWVKDRHHGTDEHGSIGHAVSHGCIRLRNRDIVRLAHLLPLGTPVTIIK